MSWLSAFLTPAVFTQLGLPALILIICIYYFQKLGKRYDAVQEQRVTEVKSYAQKFQELVESVHATLREILKRLEGDK
jgi:2-hydroxy-3-keto-5-methylthiopentenyl-1-phosphate phosphatase